MFTPNLRDFAVLVLFACLLAPVGSQDPATGKEKVETLLEQLDKSRPKDIRLSALKRLETSAKARDALQAVPLLKQCCREKDGEIRRHAQAALGAVAFFHKLPCPVEVVEGLFDIEQPVPNMVSNYVGALEHFAPECLPLLLKGLASDQRDLRSMVTWPLTPFAAKDAKVLTALQKTAHHDRYWSVRNNAHAALWRATGNLDVLLRFRLEMLQREIAAAWKDDAKDTDAMKKSERTIMHVAALGSANQILDFQKERPNELAETLIRSTKDASPVVRKGAARELGLTAVINPKSGPILAQLKVRQVLTTLGDDEDEMVRNESRLALLKYGFVELATPGISAEAWNAAIQPAEGKDNPVRAENRKPGSSDWQLTRVKVDKASGGFRSSLIEGYCSHQSVQAGDTLKIMVSTAPAARFQIEIFRTGYYGGKGARLLTTLGPLQGKEQPVPPVGERRLRECQWEPAAELKIPADWLSGVYLGRLTTLPEKESDPYWQSYVVFIVRDNRPADILFQCSDNTWQAYNRWPDNYSIYTNPKGVEGPWSDVSFDRPYAKYAQIYDNPQSIGSGEWLCFEFPLAYWLEQQGYDVAYCSNSDMINPERGLKCKAFLSVGHDEYWDIRAFNSVTKMRDAGVNLLFLSGNTACWVTPQKPSSGGRANRIIFRGGPYGAKYMYAELREKLNGPFPERGPDEGYLIGARNVDPVNGGGDWIVTKPDHWIFKGTGMKKGDRVPGLVGWEYHGDPPTDLKGLEILAEGKAFRGGVQAQHWTATIYPGPKGNFVFNASTIFWSQAMSSPPGHMLPWSHFSRPHGPDRRVQQIMKNLLSRALPGGDDW